MTNPYWPKSRGAEYYVWFNGVTKRFHPMHKHPEPGFPPTDMGDRKGCATEAEAQKIIDDSLKSYTKDYEPKNVL